MTPSGPQQRELRYSEREMLARAEQGLSILPHEAVAVLERLARVRESAAAADRLAEALEWMADASRAERMDAYAWANEAYEVACAALRAYRGEQ